ncbi:MAG: hypothetical protein UT17_C0001G0148 [Candidatus Woesebacteria bacterium GW2011_GWB1_39_10]|uniref:Uncharacterized protein n=2 Tax=Candidatus Woeseibacteriota TaxID=1752722 RepID=A0A0G0UUA7_9BACT|nr:MAG: hypothetical protein UT17_C0001G0148 [Candidatus Woesebacteria bacterium GW2011_GWB1_39_10]KKR92334.1 MAG: hypothetical protein UU42_C0002G0148 [Candidatus Woesebacteria bacterium GW2011_GWA1_41_13b]
MTTIKLISEDGKLGEEVKIWELKPRTLVSYYEYVKGVGGNRGPFIRDSFKTAYGKARNDGYVSNSGYTYEIRVSGEWKDVQVIVKHLEDALGAVDLNPGPKFLNLPDLKTFKDRVLWVLSWFKTGKK